MGRCSKLGTVNAVDSSHCLPVAAMQLLIYPHIQEDAMIASHQCPDLFDPVGRACCVREIKRRAKLKVHQHLLNDPQFQAQQPASH